MGAAQGNAPHTLHHPRYAKENSMYIGGGVVALIIIILLLILIF